MSSHFLRPLVASLVSTFARVSCDFSSAFSEGACIQLTGVLFPSSGILKRFTVEKLKLKNGGDHICSPHGVCLPVKALVFICCGLGISQRCSSFSSALCFVCDRSWGEAAPWNCLGRYLKRQAVVRAGLRGANSVHSVTASTPTCSSNSTETQAHWYREVQCSATLSRNEPLLSRRFSVL